MLEATHISATLDKEVISLLYATPQKSACESAEMRVRRTAGDKARQEFS